MGAYPGVGACLGHYGIITKLHARGIQDAQNGRVMTTVRAKSMRMPLLNIKYQYGKIIEISFAQP